MQVCATFATPLPTPTPTGVVDLQVIANPNPVGAAHGRVTFTFNYQNQSGGVINNAKLLVTVPNNTLFNPAINPPGWSCPNGPEAGKVCTLNLGNIAPTLGRSQTQVNAIALFVVDILRPLPADVNTLDIGGQIVDSNGATRATAALSVPVAPAPSFQLSVAIEPPTPKPSGLVTITINYTNNGNIALSNVILSAIVPEHSKFYGGESTQGWDCAPGSSPGTFCRISLGNIPSGQHGIVRFVIVLDANIPVGVTQLSINLSATDGNGNTLNELRDGIVIGLGKSGIIIYLPAMRR